MIRLLLALVPPEQQADVRGFVALTAVSAVSRAAACVMLVPLIAGLLSSTPGDAGGWIVAFSAVIGVNSLVQHRLAGRGFALGLVVMENVQHRLVDHLAELPLGWFSATRRTAAQRAVATTGPEVAQTLGNLVTPMVAAVLLPPTIAVGLLFVAWPLGIAALVATPLLLGALWATNRMSRRADAAFAESVADLDGRLVEFARTQRVLRGARRADPARSAAGQALAGQHSATLRLLRFSIPGQLLFSVAGQLALVALAVTTLALEQRGIVSVAECIALLVVVVRFLEPFTTLAELAPALQSAGGTLRGIHDILDAEPLAAVASATPASAAPSPTTGNGGDRAGDGRSRPPTVELTGVSFRHRDGDESADLDDAASGATTIDDVSFIARAGATTAIVGPSGSGKSTLLGLIARFHDVDRGVVRIDGRDVRSLDPAALMGGLSMVFQDVYLFEGTIRDNVVVGDPTASAEQLAAVAARARVDEIVDRLPDGWETQVGEGGVALSGGERQRVSIARALLKPAPVLLVDEATSALDTENEGAIAAALAAEREIRTTIVVAHRMRTIEQADHVVFVDAGRIVEAGPPDELLAANGRFAAYQRDRSASRAWTIGHTPSPTT